MLHNGGAPVTWICEPHHKGFTAADVAVGFGLWVGDSLGVLKAHPVLKEYLQRCTGRAAWIKVRVAQ